MKEEKEKGQCPKCKQFKATGMITLGISMFFMSSAPLFLGIFFPPLFIVAIILAVLGLLLTVVSIIMAIAKQPKNLFCMNCHYNWKE